MPTAGADGNLREAGDSVSCILGLPGWRWAWQSRQGTLGCLSGMGHLKESCEWFTSNPIVSSCSACPQDVSSLIEKTSFFTLRGASVTVDYRYAGNVCLDLLFSNGRIED